MRILLVGDVMIGRLVNEALKRKPTEAPWGDTLPIFKRADFRICNLECVISDNGTPWTATFKPFHFRTDSKNISVLKAAGIDAVSIANNHSLDFSNEGLFDTVKALDEAGIRHAGAGKDISTASSPALIRGVNGVNIAMAAFTDNSPEWEADETTPGVFYSPVDPHDSRAKRLFKIIREAKERAGFVIVSAHWGPNWGYRPLPAHRMFARQLIDNGADIVFGHSCHVFQGVEIYKGRPVIYSAGDFVDDYAVDETERNDESFIFIVETDGVRIKRMLLYPTMIIRFQARLPRPMLSEEIAVKMKTLSAEMGTRMKWHEEGEGGVGGVGGEDGKVGRGFLDVLF